MNSLELLNILLILILIILVIAHWDKLSKTLSKLTFAATAIITGALGIIALLLTWRLPLIQEAAFFVIQSIGAIFGFLIILGLIFVAWFLAWGAALTSIDWAKNLLSSSVVQTENADKSASNEILNKKNQVITGILLAILSLWVGFNDVEGPSLFNFLIMPPVAFIAFFIACLIIGTILKWIWIIVKYPYDVYKFNTKPKE